MMGWETFTCALQNQPYRKRATSARLTDTARRSATILTSLALTLTLLLQAQVVILVNCGAQADLQDLLNLQPNSGTKVIVADSHRCAASAANP